MKKLFFLIAVISGPAFMQMNCQSCTQYFDGVAGCNIIIAPDSTNVWQIGNPNKPVFHSSATLPNAIVTDTTNSYPPNNVSRFTLPIRNFFSFYGFFAVQWKQKLDLQAGHDAAVIEFSKDLGLTWQNVHNTFSTYQFYGYMPGSKDTISGEYCFSGTDSTWRDIWLCFWAGQMFQSNDTALIRFSLKSDSVESNQDGWLIDNIAIHETFVHPVKERSMKNDLMVYPNLTTGILNVEHRKNDEVHPIRSMELLDQQGRLLENYGANYAKVVLDISKYKNGHYFLRVTTARKVTNFQVILAK